MRVLERLLCLALICALLAIPTFTALADGEDDPAVETTVEETKAEDAGESAKPEKSVEKTQSSDDTGKSEETSKSEEPAKIEDKSESEKPAEADSPTEAPPTSETEGGASEEKPAEEKSEPEADIPTSTDDTEGDQGTAEVVETGETSEPESVEEATAVEEPTDTGDDGSTEEAVPEDTSEAEQPEDPSGEQEPTLSETETPEATPEEETDAPSEGEEAGLRLTLSLTDPQGLPQADGAYQVDPGHVASLTFAWKCDGKCDGYEVQVSGGVYSGSTEETTLTLSTASLTAGRYTVTVEAVLDGEVAARDALVFEILPTESESGEEQPGEKPQDGRMPSDGGFSGGGRPSGSRSGGKSRSGSGQGSGSQGGEEGQESQGFTVTAGQALTSAHSSGSKDMALYGTVALSVDSDSPMNALTLDGVALDITLDEGREAFTAALDGSALTLTPQAKGNRWTLNGYALKTLARSGIDRLYLALEDEVVPFPTQPALSGDIYSALCAAGYASGDYDYIVSPYSVEVSVDGTDYTLSEGGELIAARS